MSGFTFPLLGSAAPRRYRSSPPSPFSCYAPPARFGRPLRVCGTETEAGIAVLLLLWAAVLGEVYSKWWRSEQDRAELERRSRRVLSNGVL